MKEEELKKAQKWIIKTIKDPLVQLLYKNSFFTEKQLETFLIDIMSEEILEKKLSYKDKALIRSDKKISRGVFGRTLQQARKNMIRSTFTVLLLGYIGVLETPSLSLFLEASNKLERYMQELYVLKKENKMDLLDEIENNNLFILKNNLIKTLYSLFESKKRI